MSNNNNNTTGGTTQNSSNGEYKERSNNSYYNDFGGWQNFMHSYGLKPWDHNDVEEGKSILAAMKEQDRYEWEENKKSGGK
ncbi:hypothetical protein CYLTODRAFT_453019 [Cylindrobasidium torrendii FP15055 ss-10]|uniref:Uncharacterized protein n=1 Tax=Cylindrobasidium torrendii FP15055 ss-10 TaxID=1314674 RepID=A0A0D7BEL7_9AGAR|nr:hypothetical protein CYLTODRAFT_453019 [Cylindrobasidium torrendii FP15055 ss-10]